MLKIPFLDRGAVLRIPVDVARVGVAQVVERYAKTCFYFAVFDAAVAFDASDEELLELATTANLLFLAPSFDARVYSGDWSIVGQQPVRADITLPAYKLGTPDHYRVVDFTGKRARAVTNDEADVLEYMTFVAPVRLERALAAKYGAGEWLAKYDGLYPPKASTDEYFPSDDEDHYLSG